MSLGNFFKALRAEKQVSALTLIQDNPTRNVRSSSSPRRARKRRSKERPTLSKSILNADTVAPKLPVRQKSDDMLTHLEPFGSYRSDTTETSLCRKNAIFEDDAANTSWSTEEEYASHHHAMYEELLLAPLCDEAKEKLRQLLSR